MYSLNNIGFLEITDERLINRQGIHYCEFAITTRCNFSCSYCNKQKEKDLSLQEIDKLFKSLKDQNLQFVQLTGGEPMVRKDIDDIVKLARFFNFRVGISSNGSFPLESYLQLIESGVELFSISLDTKNDFLIGQTQLSKVAKNIQQLSKLIYINVGMVISKETENHTEEIIDYIVSLGVADIKISTDSHSIVKLPAISKRYGLPILDYRLDRFEKEMDMRGCGTNLEKCYLVDNDISIMGDKHYPCLVYAREGGKPIGSIFSEYIKEERHNWFLNTNISEDPICSAYCMDFKVAFNEKAKIMEDSK